MSTGTADRSAMTRSAPATGTDRPWASSELEIPELRKTLVYRETTLSESGTATARPVERASVSAVVSNPWVGTDPARDLAPEVMALAPALAQLLVGKLEDALGGVSRIETFGKGALIGTAGELEHGAALIHTPYFGNIVRELLEGESIICFADSRGDAGDSLVVPLWHKRHASTRSHYQTIVAHVPDAPRPDEIVVVAAASTGPRPHPRIGDRSTDPTVTIEILEDLRS